MSRSDGTTTKTVRRTEDVVDALNDPNRRFVLRSVYDAEAPLAVDDLVTRLAAFCRPDYPGDDVRPGEIRTRLHHLHLPKLVDSGLVEYDTSAATVSRPKTGDDVPATVTVMEELTASIEGQAVENA